MLPSKVGIIFPPSHFKYHCFSDGSQPLHFYLFSNVIILELAGYLLRVYARNMKSDPCICNSLRQAARDSTAFYDEMLAPSRLKLTMFRLLKLICKHPKTSITELAHIIELDRSTLGRNLRVLQKQGFVRMPMARDERARCVELTERGATALATARPLWQSAQRRMKNVTGNDLERLLFSLKQLTEFASKKVGDGRG